VENAESFGKLDEAFGTFAYPELLTIAQIGGARAVQDDFEDSLRGCGAHYVMYLTCPRSGLDACGR
jgi:hypothetical protein